MTEISTPISSDSLARPSAPAHPDYDFPTFSAQREQGWRLAPFRLSWFSLRASVSTEKENRRSTRSKYIIKLIKRIPALSIFVERAAAACAHDRTIPGVRGAEPTRTLSSTSTRLGSSNYDPSVHSCESSRRRIGTGNSSSLDSASLTLSKFDSISGKFLL